MKSGFPSLKYLVEWSFTIFIEAINYPLSIHHYRKTLTSHPSKPTLSTLKAQPLPLKLLVNSIEADSSCQ